MASIALLGDRDPSYVTHRALDVLVDRLAPDADLRWVPTTAADDPWLASADGVWAVPGTPYADESAVHDALRRRRVEGLPTLGTCGGFQHMVLEFARNHVGVQEAAHGETEPDAEQVVVSALACSLVGEVRPVTAVPGTRMAAICGLEPFDGFHFCNYGVNPRYRDLLVEAGLFFSAFAPDAGVEAVELEDHPFYLGTLFQPQMASLDGGPVHPLLHAFVEACG
ncbi:MAG: gamma-glutamyl-gamma-aminobutyrate hydrolase family protein [Candidatus Nanopelagicales bacterium]